MRNPIRWWRGLPPKKETIRCPTCKRRIWTLGKDPRNVAVIHHQEAVHTVLSTPPVRNYI